jgi:hypothetical protein
MDRYDEAKDVRPMRPEENIRSIDRDIDVSRKADVSRQDDVPDDADMPIDDQSGEHDMPTRAGDILGLGGIVPPKSPGDPATEFDDESVARRRARINEDELDGGSERPRTKGATGIDMGSGGTGTDIE